MIKGLLFIFINIFSSVLLSQGIFPKNHPLHLSTSINRTDSLDSEQVFCFQSLDSLIKHELYLLKSKDGLPKLYYADIYTPVCIDELCKPIHIEIYWDLLGRYAGFGIYPENVLTKFDHDEFESQDYVKLHQLLLDDNSVLKRRKLSDLYDANLERDRTIKFKNVEVDAISGATRKEVKNSIVDGALYTCYTLYNIIYGKAADKIRQRLPKIYSESLAQHFLQSENEYYNRYAIRSLQKGLFADNLSSLITIFKKASPLMRSYILKKMPKELFLDSRVVNEIFHSFSELDNNSKTLLIHNLKYSSSEAALLLSSLISHMSKNQLIKYLAYVENIEGQNVEKIICQLQIYSERENNTNTYFVKQFLEKHGKR